MLACGMWVLYARVAHCCRKWTMNSRAQYIVAPRAAFSWQQNTR